MVRRGGRTQARSRSRRRDPSRRASSFTIRRKRERDGDESLLRRCSGCVSSRCGLSRNGRSRIWGRVGAGRRPRRAPRAMPVRRACRKETVAAVLAAPVARSIDGRGRRRWRFRKKAERSIDESRTGRCSGFIPGPYGGCRAATHEIWIGRMSWGRAVRRRRSSLRAASGRRVSLRWGSVPDCGSAREKRSPARSRAKDEDAASRRARPRSRSRETGNAAATNHGLVDVPVLFSRDLVGPMEGATRSRGAADGGGRGGAARVYDFVP